MNKRLLNILLLSIIALTSLSVQSVFAGSTGKAYTRATAYLKDGSPSAGGKVYVGTSTTPSYASYNSSNGYFMRATSSASMARGTLSGAA